MPKNIFKLIFLLAFFILGSFSSFSLYVSNASEMPAVKRAMWVWDTNIVPSPVKSQELIKFCKTHNISILYVTAYNFNTEEIKKHYRVFNKLAHKNYIEVHALAGDPRWAIERYHVQSLKWVSDILIFNKASVENERFDGMQQDVEPYALGKAWEDNSSFLVKAYLDLNGKIANLIKQEKARLVFGVAIPFWYDEPNFCVEWNNSVKPACFHALDTVDYAAVMAYRNFADTPNGTIALSKDEVEYATKISKKVFIGQETKDEIYPEYITFANLNEKALEKEIGKIIEVFKNQNGFGGIAIHYYESYQALLRKTGNI